MGKAGSLLLIDDSPDVADLLRDFFEEKGYTVVSALNGRDALVLASLTRPDAVLLDIRMPGMQGTDVLRELRALDDSISVVMVSGTDDEELARQLLQAGAFDYVRKPFMFDHLETIVRMAVTVGKRQPLREAPSPEPWALADNEPDVDPWCARCREPLAADDPTAVCERGARYHAACWLDRAAAAHGDRELAARS